MFTVEGGVIDVTFLPCGNVVSCSRGDTLLDCALDNGIELPHECGGNCSCTTCAIYVIAGDFNLSPPEYPEIERLEDIDGNKEGIRLACQALVKRGSVIVRPLGL